MQHWRASFYSTGHSMLSDNARINTSSAPSRLRQALTLTVLSLPPYAGRRLTHDVGLGHHHHSECEANAEIAHK